MLELYYKIEETSNLYRKMLMFMFYLICSDLTVLNLKKMSIIKGESYKYIWTNFGKRNHVADTGINR